MREPEATPPYTVRESRKAKRVILKLLPGCKLEVVVPSGFNRKKVPEILRRKRDWIEKVTRQTRSLGTSPEFELCPPQSIHLRAVGAVFTVHCTPGPAGGVRLAQIGASRLELNGDLEHPELCRSLLKDWLQLQGRLHLVPWLQKVSASTGIAFRKVQVRGQKSRWGSCSAKGTISLNYKLLFLPPEMVRYILIHELCHMEQMNHSPRFWSLVGSLEPSYKTLDAAMSKARQQVPAWAN